MWITSLPREQSKEWELFASLEENYIFSDYSALFPSLLTYFTWSHIAKQYNSEDFDISFILYFYYIVINVGISSK